MMSSMIQIKVHALMGGTPADILESAETAAGRALADAGHGLQFCLERYPTFDQKNTLSAIITEQGV